MKEAFSIPKKFSKTQTQEDIEEGMLEHQNERRSSFLKTLELSAERLRQQASSLEEIKLRPRVSILADGDKIENQEVDIIDCSRETNKLQISFKLTQNHYFDIITHFETHYETGAIEYVSYEEEEDKNEEKTHKKLTNNHNLVNAFVVKSGNTVIKIAKRKYEEQEVRSAIGLVVIEIPSEGGSFKNQEIDEVIYEKLDIILKDVLKIPEGLSSPDAEAEKKYKKSRYAWHHKIYPEEVPKNIETKLVRQEVFPEYFTFVEEEKHKEYQNSSSFVVFHSLYSCKTLPSIVKAGGIISTHERYRRGLLYGGCSSGEDLKSGGGDSVFTRIFTYGGLKKNDSLQDDFGYGYSLIFNPRILDRTDWYTYNTDNYGSTSDLRFFYRISPKKIFELSEIDFNYSNEQMFRLGISLKDTIGLACQSETRMITAFDILKNAGIYEINGKPIEEFILLTKKHNDLFYISGSKKQTKNLSQLINENPGKVEQLKNEYYLSCLQNEKEKWEETLGDFIFSGYSNKFFRNFDFESIKNIFNFITTSTLTENFQEISHIYLEQILKYISELTSDEHKKYIEKQSQKKIEEVKNNIELCLTLLTKNK